MGLSRSEAPKPSLFFALIFFIDNLLFVCYYYLTLQKMAGSITHRDFPVFSAIYTEKKPTHNLSRRKFHVEKV